MLATVAALATVFLAQVVTTTVFTLPVFDQLQRDLELGEVNRTRARLRSYLDGLQVLVLDYAVWDDTVEFLESDTGSPKFDRYIQSNFPPETSEFRLDGFLFLDPNLRVIRNARFKGDLVTFDTRDFFWDSHQFELMVIPMSESSRSGHLLGSGYLQTPDGIVGYASAEIVPSSGREPVLGYLIGWHFLDSEFFVDVRRSVERPVRFTPVAGRLNDPEVATALSLLAGLSTQSHLTRDSQGELKWLLRSTTGQPLLLVSQPAPPQLFSPNWWSGPVLVSFAISALAVVALGMVFSRKIISPLLAADQTLREISRTSDFGQRLETGQWGEVGRIMGAINGLLGQINVQNHKMKEQNERLERLSQNDALTGVANRRHLDNALDAAWTQAGRDQTPMAVAMVDVDHFKAFNDHYGHQSGDRVLAQVAETLSNHLHHATDMIGRYGGEEFCIILRQTDLESAQQVADRLRVAIEDLRVPHRAASAYGYLTVSIGVASALPDTVTTIGELVREADHALYQAKSAGRNRVRSHDPTVRLFPDKGFGTETDQR